MQPGTEHTARTFDAASGSYSQLVTNAVAIPGLSADFFTKVKADYIRELAIAHFGTIDGLAALDVGCGIGNFHGLLLSAFGRLEGADISQTSLDMAKGRFPAVRYRHFDGLRLPYDDGAFDLTFTVCVMHHVPPEQWPRFAAEMGRVIRPGGLALVFEHNPRNPLTMRVVNRCPFDADAVLLWPEQMVALFAAAGFRDIRTRSILTVPAAGTALRSIDKLFGRLPLGAQYYLAAVR
jgi:SAM-dependent methyltransferase